MRGPDGPGRQEHESISLNIRWGRDRGPHRESTDQRIRIGPLPTRSAVASAYEPATQALTSARPTR
jgi:hypothetical protein